MQTVLWGLNSKLGQKVSPCSFSDTRGNKEWKGMHHKVTLPLPEGASSLAWGRSDDYRFWEIQSSASFTFLCKMNLEFSRSEMNLGKGHRECFWMCSVRCLKWCNLCLPHNHKPGIRKMKRTNEFVCLFFWYILAHEIFILWCILLSVFLWHSCLNHVPYWMDQDLLTIHRVISIFS